MLKLATLLVHGNDSATQFHPVSKCHGNIPGRMDCLLLDKAYKIDYAVSGVFEIIFPGMHLPIIGFNKILLWH